MIKVLCPFKQLTCPSLFARQNCFAILCEIYLYNREGSENFSIIQKETSLSRGTAMLFCNELIMKHKNFIRSRKRISLVCDISSFTRIIAFWAFNIFRFNSRNLDGVTINNFKFGFLSSYISLPIPMFSNCVLLFALLFIAFTPFHVTIIISYYMLSGKH